MHLTIATAGHIDHGKSALVQALTGTNPDRLKEERTRGISIELGFAHTQHGGATLSFVDVPGHERFVRTMLAGVGGIDAVLLVVSADESVMPQTREHLAICRLLDVGAGVVALTKCDVADEIMQAVARDDVQAAIAGTPLDGAEVVPVSARTGAGLGALRDALVRCAVRRRPRDLDAPPRLPIDRVFSVKGFGTVATGTLWTGVLTAESPLHLEPVGRAIRVRSLQVHGEPAARAEAGQRVAVNIAGVSHQDVHRGDVLVGSGAVALSRRLAVDVEVLADASAVRHGARVHVHLGTSAVIGRVLIAPNDDPSAPRTVAAGARAPALLRLETPLPARRGDRLVLRAYSPVTTIAGAVVVDPLGPARATDAAALERSATPAAWLEARVRDAGPLGLPAADLPARCGLSPSAVHAIAAERVRAGAIVGIGAFWAGRDSVEAIGTRMLAAVDASHAADPLAGGVPRAVLRALGGRRWRGEVVDHVLAHLTSGGLLVGEDRLARVETRAGGRSEADVRVLEAIAETGLTGQTSQEAETAHADLDRKALAAVLGRLVKARELERLGDRYIAAGHLQTLSAELKALAAEGGAPGTLEVGWFKDRYGLTRRTAIPLLEWLDRTRVTRRQGDARVLIGRE